MKTVILNFGWVLAALLFCLSCNDENDAGNSLDRENEMNATLGKPTSNWVNEGNDTISFYEQVKERGLLVYKNFDPYYTIIYDYSISDDSISLFPTHSNYLGDRTSYPLDFGTDEFALYGFNEKSKSVYKRVN